MRVEQARSVGAGRVDTEMIVREPRCHSAARGAVKKSDLDQIRFDDFLNRVFLFMYCRGNCAQADRTAIELFNDGKQKLPVHFVETVSVNFHAVQRIVRDVLVNSAFVVYFSVVSNTTQEPVNDTWCTSRALGNFTRAFVVNLDVQNVSRTFANYFQV